MKNFFFLLFFVGFTVFAQTDEPKSKVRFWAKIENRNSDTLTIFGPYRFKQVIPIKDGVFEATLETRDGLHVFSDGAEQSRMFFKDGYDLKLSMDAKEFDETISFEGTGAKENNHMAKKALENEKFQENLESLLKDDIEKASAEIKQHFDTEIKDIEVSGLDPLFIEAIKKSLQQDQMMLMQYAMEMQAAAKLNGTQSPSFNYENYKGGKTKLESFKGKYVYIDVWATWCGPCRAEIPHLKELEKEFHKKKIAFVSISIDKVKDHDKWKTFVKEKELTGVQLFADNDWNSEFVKAYGINGIPRFILIGPDGKIIDSNAPRPSSKEIREKIIELLK